MRLEHLEISFYVHFLASYGLKHIKICVTRNWNVDRERSNNCILTDFEKLLYRSQSFAQTNFYSFIENIFSKFNHQKLNPFERNRISHPCRDMFDFYRQALLRASEEYNTLNDITLPQNV